MTTEPAQCRSGQIVKLEEGERYGERGSASLYNGVLVEPQRGPGQSHWSGGHEAKPPEAEEDYFASGNSTDL